MDSPKRTRRWGQATEALLAVLRARFEHIGVPTSTADGYARNALLALAEYAGGRDFYLPRAVLLKAAIRDAEIRREFNGRNYVELAAKHQLTVAHVRRIIKARSRTTKAPPRS